jgi:hypothetical protein
LEINDSLISDVLKKAKKLDLVQGLVGGEKRGYISPGCQFIELAGWRNHNPLAKILGFEEGTQEMIAAGFVRVAHSDHDMNYEFVWHDEAVSNINASISWNIGMEIWPRNAVILIDIIGQGNFRITTEDFVNANCDLKTALVMN